MTTAISTIIPTFNRARWISRAIESVLSQMTEEDELIVVDDGSTDDTSAVVQGFGKLVKYIRTENRGAGAARNHGIREATRPLIAFLDSDDEWKPDHNAVLRSLMSACPDLLFCFSNFSTQFPDGSIRPFALETQDGVAPDWGSVFGPARKLSDFLTISGRMSDYACYETSNLYRAQCDRSYVSVDGLLVRRAAAGQILRFAEDTATAEEWECGALLARAGRGLYVHFESTLVHHHTAGQLTDLSLATLAASRLTIMPRVWGSDPEFLRRYGAYYEGRLREERLIKAAGALLQGRSQEARQELAAVSSVPISYRVLSWLPGPATRIALDSRRGVKKTVEQLRQIRHGPKSAPLQQTPATGSAAHPQMQRIRSIDIVRGSAMMLVLAAHALKLGDPNKIGFLASGYFGMITQSASVAFMLASGMITTYLLRSNPNWKSMRRRFFRRGLFLLLVIHPVIVLATYLYFARSNNFVYEILHGYEITDTIGICLILAPTIIHGLSQTKRVVLVLAMLVVALIGRLSLHPNSALLGTVEAFLFELDGTQQTWLQVGWPLVPWLAIFLCGSVVGEMYYKMREGLLSYQVASQRLFRIAITLGFSGVMFFAAFELLKSTNPFSWSDHTFILLYPARTTFMLPLYIGLIFGLVSLLISSVEGNRTYNRVYWMLSIFGRTSLFAFVTQFLILWTIPALLGLKARLDFAQLLLAFALAAVLCWGLSYSYARFRGRAVKNDYFHLRQFSH